MEVDTIQWHEATEGERVMMWRWERLMEAGYGEHQSTVLANCDWVDIHEAVALLEAGCPPNVAAQILL